VDKDGVIVSHQMRGRGVACTASRLRVEQSPRLAAWIRVEETEPSLAYVSARRNALFIIWQPISRGRRALMPSSWGHWIPTKNDSSWKPRRTRAYAAPGYLLFTVIRRCSPRIRSEALRFDGRTNTILNDIQYQPQVKRAVFGASKGVLAAQSGIGVALSELLWF